MHYPSVARDVIFFFLNPKLESCAPGHVVKQVKSKVGSLIESSGYSSLVSLKFLEMGSSPVGMLFFSRFSF